MTMSYCVYVVRPGLQITLVILEVTLMILLGGKPTKLLYDPHFLSPVGGPMAQPLLARECDYASSLIIQIQFPV